MPELNAKRKGQITKLWLALPVYCDYVEKTLAVRISPVDLLLALMEATGKEFQDLARLNWSNDKIVQTVRNTKIIKMLPAIAEEITVSETVIPANVIRNITEEEIKFKGEKWVVHKNDADPFPSKPHAHNYEAGLKLHLGNGDLYRGTELVGRIPLKKFKALRSLFKVIELPVLE